MEWTSKFNPFNSDKLFAHYYRWKNIQRGREIPPPISMTLDPINKCNLDCTWCNADYILNKNKNELSDKTMKEIADFISEWGVETVCIAGGGEPLLSKNITDFVNRCDYQGVETGVVTNGTMLNRHDLTNCTWIGVSIDAGTPETYKKLKGKDMFDKVISNISDLTKTFNRPGQGRGVSYKYLLHPGNVSDVYQAAKIAKEIGCRNMHIRPFGEPWDKVGKLEDKFTYSDIQEFNEQLEKARELEDDFRIFGITHKFDGDFRKQNEFKNWYAIVMQGVLMPPKGQGNFDYGLCCDRRGDERITLHDSTTEEVRNFWGSEKHWEMFDKINVKDCPRCTYQPHNKIYEKTILEENMTFGFI